MVINSFVSKCFQRLWQAAAEESFWTQEQLPATQNCFYTKQLIQHLGTPALPPIPEDWSDCRRFFAVASGWDSASCWSASCRALRDAASLEWKIYLHEHFKSCQHYTYYYPCVTQRTLLSHFSSQANNYFIHAVPSGEVSGRKLHSFPQLTEVMLRLSVRLQKKT